MQRNINEQKFLLNLKKDLEFSYKGFIKCVFDYFKNSALYYSLVDKEEKEKMVGKVDARLNGLIIKLSEYYESKYEQTERCSLACKSSTANNKLSPKYPSQIKVSYKPMERICVTGREEIQKGSRKAIILGNKPIKPYIHSSN